MHRIIALLLTVLAFGSVVPVQAEDPIYVVDIQRIISESIIGKAARNNMEAEVKKAEGRFSVIKTEIDRMRTDTAKQQSLLSPEALEEKRSAIEKKERELQRQMADQREELGRKNDAEMKRLIAEIDAAIKDVATKGNYLFVIEKDPRVVVYASDRLDLTDQVVKHLNSKKL